MPPCGRYLLAAAPVNQEPGVLCEEHRPGARVLKVPGHIIYWVPSIFAVLCPWFYGMMAEAGLLALWQNHHLITGYHFLLSLPFGLCCGHCSVYFCPLPWVFPSIMGSLRGQGLLPMLWPHTCPTQQVVSEVLEGNDWGFQGGSQGLAKAWLTGQLCQLMSST